MHPQNTWVEFDRLLQARNDHPELAEAIDAQLQVIFGEIHAILALDMSGFSRLTIRYSIIHFLATIRRLWAIAHPCITQHNGSLIKQEADNLFAIFPSVEEAIDAAIDIFKGIVAVNIGLPDRLDLQASIGIGYGDVLLVEGKDLFGSEMNLASKLGEDLARPGEILLTQSAYDQVDPNSYAWEVLQFSISGLNVPTYKVVL